MNEKPQEPQNPQPTVASKQTQPQDPQKALGDAMREYVAQNPAPSLTPEQMALANAARVVGYMKSQEADGIFDWGTAFAGDLTKKFADGTAHLGNLSLRLLGSATSVAHLENPSKGWQRVGEALKSVTGSDDPGAWDYLNALAGGPKSVNVYDPVKDTTVPMTVGDASDEFLRRKLGKWQIVSSTAGALGSFMGGPGAIVGQVGAKAAGPLAGIVERSIARKIASGVMGSRESVEAMVNSGRAIELLTQAPQWRTSMSAMDRLLAMGGRNVRDMMGMAAGNIAQSYALSPDSHRLDAAKFALYSAPFATAIVKLGEKLSSAVLTSGLSGDDLKVVGEAYRNLLNGKISPQELAGTLNTMIPGWKKIGADAVSGAFEGTAFMAMDPHAREAYGRWLKGDSDAGADLLASFAGSMAGITAYKSLIGVKDSHLFRTVRPDLNSIDTAIEAEAMRRTIAEQNKKTAAQQQQPAPVVEPPRSKTPQEQFYIDEKALAASRQASARADAGAGQQEGGFGGEQVAPSEEFSANFDRSLQDAKGQYSWASKPLAGLMRSTHVEPKMQIDGSITFDLGNDYSVDVTTEMGEPVLWFDPTRMLPMMKDAGRPIGNYETIAPTKAKVSGDAAKKLIDDITLLRLQRTMQGDLDFSRLGMEQVDGRNDLWQPPSGGGFYYTIGIDGEHMTVDKMTGKSETVNFAVSDGWGDQKHQPIPAADALMLALQSKQMLSPDPVIDGIVGRALMMAMHSDSVGAQQIREFLANSDPQQIVGMLNPREDQILAFQLGTLGVGDNNARHALDETQRMRTAEADARSDYERSIAEDLASAKQTPSESPDDFVAKLEGRNTKEEDRYLASHEASNQRYREGMEDAVVERPEPSSYLPDLMSGPKDTQDRKGESGMVAAGAMASDLKKAMGDLLRDIQSGGKKAKQAMRGLVDRMPELLRGKGDDPFVEDIRAMNARKGENVGELQLLAKPAEKAIRAAGTDFIEKIEKTDGGPMPRWQAGLEGRKVEVPFTDAELNAISKLQELYRRSWDLVKQSGGVRWNRNEESGAYEPRPMGSPENVRHPRIWGRDMAEVLADKNELTGLATDLIRENKLTVREKDGNVRPMTPQEFIDEWFAPQESASSVDTPGRISAAEKTRLLKWFPSVRNGKELLETNPFEALRRVTRQQAGRAASLERLGPDLSSHDRKIMQERYGVTYTPERQGVQSRIAKAIKAMPLGPDGEFHRGLARDLVTDIEGGMPDRWQFKGPTGSILRGIYNVDAPVRSNLTLFGFLQDVGDTIFNTGTLIGRPAKTLRMLADVVMHPIDSAIGIRDAVVYAKRVGNILMAEGQRDVLEASSWWQKWIDLVQLPNITVENFKIAYFTKWADRMMADWTEGTITSNDRWLLRDMLVFSPEQQRALLSGQADKSLQSVFRREFTQLAVSRRPIGEGSAFSASPVVRSLLRFTNWSSGNLYKVARAYKSTFKDMAAGLTDGDWKRSSQGFARGIKIAGLQTASGVIGKLLAYTLADLFRGENGAKRWWNEVAYATTHPAAGFRYLRDAIGSQALGGPAATLLNAFTRPDTERYLATITAPGAVIYALAKAFDKPMPTSPIELAKRVGSLTSDLGYVPLGQQFKQAIAASAAIAGADSSTRNAMRMAWNWKQLEHINEPEFDRTKPDEFYDALASIRRAIGNHPSDPNAAIKESEVALREALKLGDERGLASSLRSYQFLQHVPKDKLDKFSDFMGEEGMARVYAHDQAIQTFAKLVGLMHGENPAPFDRELSIAEGQARLGGAQVWEPLASRVVDDAATRIEHGQDSATEDIRHLAESMAAFPEQQKWMTERQLRAIGRSGMSYPERVRLIEAILRRQAHDRAVAERRSVRKVAKTQGVDLAPFR